MKTLINFENVVKFATGIIAICGLYYALDKRLALMEQKLDYYIATNNKENDRSELQVLELKTNNEETKKELAELRERIIRIYAVLPKRIELTDDEKN